MNIDVENIIPPNKPLSKW